MALPPVKKIEIDTPVVDEDGEIKPPAGGGTEFDSGIAGVFDDRFNENLAIYLRNVQLGDKYNNARNLATTLGQATGSIG